MDANKTRHRASTSTMWS